MIARDPAAAARSTFDVLIVGGGIFGAAALLEAARRGLRGALVERGDFGGETSWSSLRIAHGGLRYLQSADLRRFHESVGERSWLLREFPDLVEPLRFVLPLDGRGLRRPALARGALALNDLLSAGRSPLPRSRVLSAAEAVQAAPPLARRPPGAAATWYDGFMPDSQRIVIEMLHWAAACGAVALNYCEALEALVHSGAVAGLRVRDRVGGAELELRAPRIVNCAGPWCDEVARRLDSRAPALFRPSLGFNLLLDREPGDGAAVGVPAPRGGSYFLVPWKGLTLAGTHHEPWPGDNGVPREVVERFLDGLNRALPGLDLTHETVLRVHWGRLPAIADGSAVATSRDRYHDHAAAGGPRGLVSIRGVKFTTARAVAEQALRRLLAGERRDLPAYASPRRPPATPPPAVRDLERTLARDPAAARAEVARIVAQESVVHLDDLLLRRTDWGADPRKLPGLGSLGDWL